MFFLRIDTAVKTSRIRKGAVHKETWQRLILISTFWVKFVRTARFSGLPWRSDTAGAGNPTTNLRCVPGTPISSALVAGRSSVMSITINAHLFEAFLKCPTKCYLRSLDETGTENAYADWVRTQNESYRSEGIKRLMEGAAPDEFVVGPPGMENLKTAKWRLGREPRSPCAESGIQHSRRGKGVHQKGRASPHSSSRFDSSSPTNSPATTSCYWRSMRSSFRKCWAARLAMARSSTGMTKPR